MTSCRWRPWLLLGLLLALIVVPCVRADDDVPIPLAVKVPLFLKIMSYDRTVGDTPATQTVRLILLVGAGHAGDERRQDETLLRNLVGGRTLLGRPLACECESWKASKPPRTDASSLVIGHALSADEVRQVAEWASAKNVLIFGDGATAWAGRGFAVVLLLRGGAPVINVDLPVARSAGADFHANFLKHCQVRQ